MRDTVIGKIIRNVRVLDPGAPVARAAEAMRAAGLAELPVVKSGRILGMVTEASILDSLHAGEDAGREIDSLIIPRLACVTPYATVAQVAEVMKDHDAQVVPVINEYGVYLGVVTRSDIGGALSLTLRPPSVGGLATPLGVFLTTGHIRAGASDLGLFLTGISMGLLFFLSQAAIVGLAWALQQISGQPVIAMMNSPSIGAPNWMDALQHGMSILSVGIFLLLVRAVSLSGYHAAEHQVINAIENGEQLRPENVRLMPRVHVRCGTNLLTAVMLFLFMVKLLSADFAVLLTAFVLIFGWRQMGGVLQQYVTTKPPSDRQLRSGIEAGEELLAKYRENPSFQVTGWARLWNIGLPQVMIGMSAIMSLGALLDTWAPFLHF